MKVRLGYVAMTMNLKDASPSKTVTITTYNKIESEEGKRNRLERITKTNLENTLRILRYNKVHDIYVYRFTSKLVPLATYLPIENWYYQKDFEREFKEIGKFVKENNMRVSAHPDHFTIINSLDEKVFQDSLRDLEYHYQVFKAMGLEDSRYKLVLHVGGLYGDKKASMQRFIDNFQRLPEYIQNKIIIENDDKIYTARDVLYLCQQLNIPMVLDIHHYQCNNEGEELLDLLPLVFNTWENEYFNPKVHFSTPKNEKQFRSHADEIDADSFFDFIEKAKLVNRDIDVMLEAKNKDNALFRLMEKIKEWGKVKIINNSTFEY
ncbi:MAG: UV DNA damage repair endonuclease UvsE [Clostridiaceae bacterium]|nr:UV DNA damage repair endonuclease UvsE [Clostridiaceae bacterium]